MDLEFSHMTTSTYKGGEETQRKWVCTAMGSGPSQRQLVLESSFLKFCQNPVYIFFMHLVLLNLNITL